MNLRDLLRPELIATDVVASDWESAIRATGKLLVNDGAVEPRFVDAMIRVAKEFGPYIVVAPGIALPHARPDDGVIHASIAVSQLKDTVTFGNVQNDPVFLVIALAAIDNKQHIEALAELASVLGNADNIERLKQCKTADDMLKVLYAE
ncbi:MAG: PTS sugar transporter subunit IIA [Chloroflexi bacterium]|nr:PTS sugar transporter subunit IIA [Anaerolineaceae bacterium]NMB88168.1 PTS sugar transporter subunit IIA [Chloroflexota bacterium]